jgi:hypothetical protein
MPIRGTMASTVYPVFKISTVVDQFVSLYHQTHRSREIASRGLAKGFIQIFFFLSSFVP